MKTILVLEDEVTIRDMLCLVLSSMLADCAVLDAPDGLQGVAILKRRHVDLIVTDLKMPNLDGFGVIEQARRMYPATPVYVMSANSELAMRARLLPMGISRYFEKPFSFETMAEIAAGDLGLFQPVFPGPDAALPQTMAKV